MACAFLSSQTTESAISSSLASLGEPLIQDESTDTRFVFGDLSKTTKDDLTKTFHREFAIAAKKQFGTWIKAAGFEGGSKNIAKVHAGQLTFTATL
jgi:hypothetical protein